MEPSTTSLCLDMEDLALQPEMSSSDIYFSLGLQEKVKGNAGNPRVLSLLSSLLERSLAFDNTLIGSSSIHAAALPALLLPRFTWIDSFNAGMSI